MWLFKGSCYLSRLHLMLYYYNYYAVDKSMSSLHTSSSLAHVGFSLKILSTDCTGFCFVFPLNGAVSLSSSYSCIRGLVTTSFRTGGET